MVERRSAQTQSEGVQRSYPDAADIGEAGLHLVRRPRVVGDQGHCAGRESPAFEQQPGPFGEHPRLARAGRSNDTGSRARLGHGCELVRREENADRLVRTEGAEHPMLKRYPVEHR